MILPLLALALAAPAADTIDYPAWRGADGSGAARDSGAELVERFADGRFAWASEAENPLPYDYKGLGRPQRMIGNGGYGPPVLADGRLYVATFTPTGPLATVFWENVDEDSPDAVKHIDADDTLTCLDAVTGLTLWQTRIPESGINFAAKMYAGQYAPCVADGRVVWVGCLGQMHCVDAVSGEHLWSQSTGGSAELDARYRRYLLDVGKIGGRGPNDPGFENWQPTPDAPLSEAERSGSRGFGWDSATRVIDGVVVANTRDGDAVAHDLATGAQRWRRRGALAATRGPLIWRHGDQGHVVTVNNSQIACLDPRTGAERWTTPCGGGSYNGHTPAIHGDRLVATGPDGGGFACWRLRPDGAEKLWELPKLFASGYESPLLYRDHLWISRLHAKKALGQWDDLATRWPQAFTDQARQALLTDDGRPAFRNLLACVALADGTVTACVGMPMLDHASLVASDGRLVLNTYGLTLMDADPTAPRILDTLDVQNIWCTTPVIAGGRVYFRGTRHLVNCWDLRKHETPQTAAEGDWRNALIRLDLAGIRQPTEDRRVTYRRGGTAPMPPGEDLRLHLRSRDGVIRQAWMTYGPAHADPEQVWTDGLTL
ncbi:MAG: PQQ-binding-like beta-propeller repeat protein, partial [Planctomycetota bacterium]